MAEYLSPGVFTESISKGGAVVEAVSASTAGFIGFAKRGTTNKAVFINSWSAYLSEFAGEGSAFDADNYLSYAVYGFFQNGGKRCYVVRVAGTGIASATADVKETGNDKPTLFTVTAKNGGTWANGAVVTVTSNADLSTTENPKFDVTITLGETVEKFTGVDGTDVLDTINAGSTLVTASATASITLANGATGTLAGGNNGTNPTALTTDMLNTGFGDVANEISMVASPDLTSQADSNILIGYADANRMVAVLQGEGTENVTTIKTLRKGLVAGSAMLYYPYIEVTDPLSNIGGLKSIPPCGHIMGVYARTIVNRGVWKNPAGVECSIVGAVKTHAISATQGSLSTADTDVLNPLGINAIMSRPNYGICIWGCRSLMSDTTLRYAADVMLKYNIMKSLQEGTQPLVFEPHDRDLWTKATATVTAFLDTMWRDGAFFGDTSSEAYYVKCDGENNPEASRNLGRLVIECGYAQKKPAEFVIIRIAHQMQN